MPLAGWHNFFANQPAPMCDAVRQYSEVVLFSNAWLSEPGRVHAVLQTQTQPARLIKMSMSNQTHNDEHVQPDLTVVHVVLHHGMFTLRMACPAL